MGSRQRYCKCTAVSAQPGAWGLAGLLGAASITLFSSSFLLPSAYRGQIFTFKKWDFCYKGPQNALDPGFLSLQFHGIFQWLPGLCPGHASLHLTAASWHLSQELDEGEKGANYTEWRGQRFISPEHSPVTGKWRTQMCR